jgi:ABC-type sulfate transport system permease subunit
LDQTINKEDNSNQIAEQKIVVSGGSRMKITSIELWLIYGVVKTNSGVMGFFGEESI